MAEEREEEFTSLEKIGEFGLIKRLTQNFPLSHSSTIKGIGDDAAILEFLSGRVLVSTDMLVEGVHFDLGYVPPQHLGYKAVVVNLSDIYAMNGRPTQITVNLAISNRFGIEYLDKIYEGIRKACEVYEVDLIGGDTTSSYSGLMISITAIGEVEEGEEVLRSGAKDKDLVVVSGDLGGAYMGLQILEREKRIFKENPDIQPELGGNEYVLERQLKPEARKDIVELLKELEVKPSSMIDISDGLSSEIIHLCKQAKVGCDLYENKIPLDPQVISTCEEFNIDSTTVALNGGEDYELLFTVSQDNFPKIKANPNFSVIGYIKELSSGMHLVTRAETQIPLKAQGWKSFKD